MAPTTEHELTINFGALAPPLRAQLTAQGFHLTDDAVRVFEENANAITRLYLKDLLTRAETDRARKRLMKRIIEALNREGA